MEKGLLFWIFIFFLSWCTFLNSWIKIEQKLWWSELDKILLSDKQNLVNMYDTLDKSLLPNISNVLINNFDKLKDLKDFTDFDKEFDSSLMITLSLKLNNLKYWKKYWLFKYDYYIQEKDEYFLEDIWQFWDKPKEGYLLVLRWEFDRINKWIKKVSIEDLGIDLRVYYNELPLKEALLKCVDLRKEFGQEYKWDIHSCEDKIYFYRATIENKYCEKITDKFKVRVCKDFLGDQGQIKK